MIRVYFAIVFSRNKVLTFIYKDTIIYWVFI